MKVAVVGLGVAGSSICAALAAAGHEVWGYEQTGEISEGSSRGDTRIFRLTPGEGRIYVDLAERARAGWRRLEGPAKGSLLWPTDGLMAGPSGSAFVQSCIDLCRARDRAYEPLSGAEVAGLTGGAVRLPDDWAVCRQMDCGVMQVPAALEALRRFALEHGARLSWNTPVAGPITGPRLRIDGVDLTFDRVIVSGGAWTGRLAAPFAGALRPARRVVAWFRPRGATPNPSVICLDDPLGLFGMPTPDGLYKVGLDAVGAVDVDPDRVEPAGPADLEPLSDAVRRCMPGLDPEPVRADACLYTLAEDHNFLVAEHPDAPAVLVFSCCSGHGFKYGPVLGELALDWIEQRPSAALASFGAGAGRESPSLQLGKGP